MKKKPRRLSLHRETVRLLSPEHLRERVAGGETNNRTCIPETFYCPTGPAVCDTTVLRC